MSFGKKYIFLVVFVFIVSNKLLLQVDFYPNHTQLRADVQELDTGWSNFTVTDNSCLVALKLNFSV